jgi:hypothetical protein
MTRLTLSHLFTVAILSMVAGVARPAPLCAQGASDLAGRWTLNRGLGTAPAEIGFNLDWVANSAAGPDAPASGGRGGRGGRGGSRGGSGAATPFSARPESVDDAKRVQQLTAEVRDPSVHLTFVDTPTAVTITDDRGQSRTFHPDGRDEVIQLDGVPVGVTAKRDAGKLVVLYRVEEGRQLRYTYSRMASPAQVVVDVQFLEHGGGDEVRRVYEPTSANETLTASAAAAVSGQANASVPASPSGGRPATQPTNQGPANQGPPYQGAANQQPANQQPVDQQPDAELKGLTKLGMVVEGLSAQAATCGLNQSTLEAAVSKHLTDAGFKVLRNSDEDTYAYVNINTASLSTGYCISRYDVTIYTHTTARLSYGDAPVLVEVSLLRKGGLTGGAPAAHADGVLRGVLEYVDQFATRIRDANKPRPAQ